MSSTARVVTWVLLAAWALFAVIFVAKFHSFVRHPLGHASGGGGGIFFVLSQAALGAAVILMWQLRKQDA